MIPFALGLLLSLRLSAAAPLPPDYADELVRAQARRLEALNAAGQPEVALAEGRRFVQSVRDAAAVRYEMGLAANRLGDLGRARDEYDAALRLDPEHAAARYDRAELRLGRGDLDGAREDLLVAGRLRPDHWVVPFRLAQIAGRQQDPRALEAQLEEAVRRGFDLRTLFADPEWRAWMDDPTLGPPIRKLVVVYSDESLLDGLGG